MTTLFHSLPQHLSASSIERVDVDRAGNRVLTLCDGPPLQCWSESPSGWTLTGPIDDIELPFRSLLSGELAHAGSRVLTWKPGRRLTLLAQRPSGPVVIKAYRQRGFDAARAAHREAQAALTGSEWMLAGFRGEHPEHSYLEFAFVEGLPLDIVEQSSTHFFRLGAGLRQLQSARLKRPAREHTILEEQRVLDVMRKRALAACGVLPDQFDSALERLCMDARRIPTGDSVPAHRDLHDGQILLSGGRLTCLDFDLLCHADSALDPANLAAHLQLRVMQKASGATSAGALVCARAFLEGLDRDEEVSFGLRLCWYQASSFLRLAAVHTMRPRWAHLAPGLLALATRCMEDLERA